MNPIILILLYTEGIGVVFGIIRIIFIYRKDQRKRKEIMAELHRKQDRIKAAYALHEYVMRTYGIQYIQNLASPSEIINDNKPITVFNYLDI